VVPLSVERRQRIRSQDSIRFQGGEEGGVCGGGRGLGEGSLRKMKRQENGYVRPRVVKWTHETKGGNMETDIGW